MIPSAQTKQELSEYHIQYGSYAGLATIMSPTSTSPYFCTLSLGKTSLGILQEHIPSQIDFAARIPLLTAASRVAG